MLDFRPFEPEDFDACQRIALGIVPEFIGEVEIPLFAAFLKRIQAPLVRYVVGIGEGQVLACGGVSFEASTRIATFCWGLVDRSAHLRGYGSQLVIERLSWIESGWAVELGTSQHTAAFYARFGFLRGRVEKDGYAPGLDRIAMRRAPSAGGAGSW